MTKSITKYKHPLYGTWVQMKNRCYNSKAPAFRMYGRKGITVCDRWLGSEGFYNFLADMGEKPTPKHTIDRVNNKLGYCLENCRWATLHEQLQSRARAMKHMGVSYNAKTGTWRAAMIFNRKMVLSKTFYSEEEAWKARQAAEVVYYGKTFI